MLSLHISTQLGADEHDESAQSVAPLLLSSAPLLQFDSGHDGLDEHAESVQSVSPLLLSSIPLLQFSATPGLTLGLSSLPQSPPFVEYPDKPVHTVVEGEHP